MENYRRTHAPRKRELPCRRILPRAEDLFALVVCPKTAHGVRHLTQPRPRDPVEQSARASRSIRLLYALYHALVARRLQPDLRQVERATQTDIVSHPM